MQTTLKGTPIAAANSEIFMSITGESSSSLNTASWSFPLAKSMESVDAVRFRISVISPAAIFSG